MGGPTKLKKRKLHSNHDDAARPRKLTQKPVKGTKSTANSTTKPTAKTTARPPKKLPPTLPFHASDRILLLGEGDFSFAKSLVADHACYDLTATCYDSQERLFEKYESQAAEHTAYLEEAGQTVLYSVDATKLDTHKALRKLPLFDVLMFNFPHIGGKSTDVNRQVRANQELLVGFFGACQALLAPDGTVVVTLFEGEPYTLWNVRDLARHKGLAVKSNFAFQAVVYSGYKHARTLGNVDGGGGWKGEERDARSFVFGRKEGGKGGKQIGGKRKRGGESEDEG